MKFLLEVRCDGRTWAQEGVEKKGPQLAVLLLCPFETRVVVFGYVRSGIGARGFEVAVCVQVVTAKNAAVDGFGEGWPNTPIGVGRIKIHFFNDLTESQRRRAFEGGVISGFNNGTWFSLSPLAHMHPKRQLPQ